ncbi:hypothetical protein [Xanthobacter versatilis]|uniref:hypothetical protein n=1 Tax=Xanthobacter autotrophicus (strain ATCC BAA-1158 / Py2) TaxID=78245 RepID=UPI003728C352
MTETIDTAAVVRALAMQTYELRDFLARSTDQSFDDTTLAHVLAALPPLSATGPWLAGGSLRRSLLRQEPDSDFDLFFRDADQLEDFRNGVEAAGLVKVRETVHHVHYRGRVGGSIERDVQLIRFAFYGNAAAVIDSFDFTICQIAYDGEKLFVGEHTLWDLARKRLAVNKITFPVSSTRRMLKYAAQGFTACNGCLSALLRSTIDNPELRMDIAYVD